MSIRSVLLSFVSLSLLVSINISADEGKRATATKIPDWIRNNAAWWAEGLITDEDFAKTKFGKQSTGVFGTARVKLNVSAEKERFAFERVVHKSDGTYTYCRVKGVLNGQIEAKAKCRPIEIVSQEELNQSTVPFDVKVNRLMSRDGQRLRNRLSE